MNIGLKHLLKFEKAFVRDFCIDTLNKMRGSRHA